MALFLVAIVFFWALLMIAYKDHLERIRTQVECGPEAPSYTTTYNAADTFDRS